MSSFYVSCIGAEKFKSAEQALADVPGGMERALRSATKRAASFLRTQSTKEIRQRYDITRKNIRAEQNVNVSYRYFNGIEARITFRGNKIPLWRYGGSSPSKPTVNTEKPSWQSSTAICARFTRALPRPVISWYRPRRPHSPAHLSRRCSLVTSVSSSAPAAKLPQAMPRSRRSWVLPFRRCSETKKFRKALPKRPP